MQLFKCVFHSSLHVIAILDVHRLLVIIYFEACHILAPYFAC